MYGQYVPYDSYFCPVRDLAATYVGIKVSNNVVTYPVSQKSFRTDS